MYDSPEARRWPRGPGRPPRRRAAATPVERGVVRLDVGGQIGDRHWEYLPILHNRPSVATRAPAGAREAGLLRQFFEEIYAVYLSVVATA